MLLKVFGWICIILSILICIGALFIINEFFEFDPEMKIASFLIAALVTFLSCFNGIFLIAIGDMQVNIRKLEKSNRELLAAVGRPE